MCKCQSHVINTKVDFFGRKEWKNTFKEDVLKLRLAD